jgi:hypothetical protein
LEAFARYWRIVEVFILARCDKLGRIYGFAQLAEVTGEKRHGGSNNGASNQREGIKMGCSFKEALGVGGGSGETKKRQTTSSNKQILPT